MSLLLDDYTKDLTVKEFLEEYKDYEGPDIPILIDGKVYMQAAPSIKHNNIIYNIGATFGVFAEPFCLIVSNSAFYVDEKTYIQPDLMLRCGKGDDEFTPENPPTIVVEVLSTSSTIKDMIINSTHCMQAGVCEYWIVHQDRDLVIVHDFAAGTDSGYPVRLYNGDSVITSNCFPKLKAVVKYMLHRKEGKLILSPEDLI